jgi:maleylacetate reductase
MALLHKLCHTLGGSFDTPHAETDAIRLPHMVGFNAAAVCNLLEPISSALGGATPGKALHRFASGLGAPTRLKDLGLTETDLDRAATTAEPVLQSAAFRPGGDTRAAADAWTGREPPM